MTPTPLPSEQRREAELYAQMRDVAQLARILDIKKAALFRQLPVPVSQVHLLYAPNQVGSPTDRAASPTLSQVWRDAPLVDALFESMYSPSQ